MRVPFLLTTLAISTVILPTAVCAGSCDHATTRPVRVAKIPAKAGNASARDAKSGTAEARRRLEGESASEVAAAARAIRRALDEEEDFSSANLRVMTGNRRVIVEGTVATKKLRAAIIHAAAKAAPGANVDFMLEVSEE